MKKGYNPYRDLNTGRFISGKGESVDTSWIDEDDRKKNAQIEANKRQASERNMERRDSGGVRNSTTINEQEQITDIDWMNWAEDPEIFQYALNGESKPPYISQSDGHKYTKAEWERAKKVAPKIQKLAEEGTVNNETLYRGESFDSLLEARRKYKIGKTITNDKLTSYATNVDIARAYAGENIDFMEKGAVKVVISNTNLSGKSVGVMTDPLGAGGSNEIITPKGMKSYVKNTRYDEKSNTLYVELGNNAKPKRKR